MSLIRYPVRTPPAHQPPQHVPRPVWPSVARTGAPLVARVPERVVLLEDRLGSRLIRVSGAPELFETADPGSYDLVGTDLGIELLGPADVGSYDVIGTDVGGELLAPADPDGYDVVGMALDAELMSVADPDAYDVVGMDAGMDVGVGQPTEIADPGSYELLGSDVVFDRPEVALPGAYTVSGAGATAWVELWAETGALDLAGLLSTAATGSPADPGAYEVLGFPAEVGGDEDLAAEAGEYGIAGDLAHLQGTSPWRVRLPHAFPDPVTGEWDAYALQENLRAIVAVLRQMERRLAALESRQ